MTENLAVVSRGESSNNYITSCDLTGVQESLITKGGLVVSLPNCAMFFHCDFIQFSGLLRAQPHMHSV